MSVVGKILELRAETIHLRMHVTQFLLHLRHPFDLYVQLIVEAIEVPHQAHEDGLSVQWFAIRHGPGAPRLPRQPRRPLRPAFTSSAGGPNVALGSARPLVAFRT